MTEIKAFGPHPLDCEFCGGCVQICPVGAITSRLSMYEYRPWMLKRADTICQYCGDGCQITVQAKDNHLIEVNSSFGAGRNNDPDSSTGAELYVVIGQAPRALDRNLTLVGRELTHPERDQLGTGVAGERAGRVVDRHVLAGFVGEERGDVHPEERLSEERPVDDPFEVLLGRHRSTI